MTTQTTASADIDVVRAGFESLARGDLATFTDMFHTDATWNHRNEDRFGGVHRGNDNIVAFITESVQLTAGTLRPVPTAFMANGSGQVAVPTHLTASRPDGRTFDDLQVLLFTVDGGRVRAVEQFIGQPRAATAFWA
jgi:ketosteroid isomerase-like protein